MKSRTVTPRHATPSILGAALATSVALSTLPAAAKPWKGAELITNQTFEYGAFEARIRAARGSGIITPFFLWKNNSEIPGVPWQEQDFEIFGRDGTYQTQLMTPGTGGAQRTEHVVNHTLPTAAYDRYYTYRMEWTPDYLAFYVDGQLVRRETNRNEYGIFLDPSRAEPAQLRVSIWAGDTGWSGNFDESAVPAAVFVDWVQVYSYSNGGFSPLWRDDFDFFDNGRWWTANWTFDYAVNDYIGQNATTRNGKLVLVFTDESGSGQFPTPPDDGAPPGTPPSNPPPGNPPPSGCASSREYPASALSASTGAATSDGWNLWTNGTLSTNHGFAAGEQIVSVRARGQAAAGQWPHMTVLAGGEVIGEATVDTTSYSAYEFYYDASAGSRAVTIRFDNDYYQDGEDRNLYVESLSIDACLD
jgi:hypothetical protein